MKKMIAKISQCFGLLLLLLLLGCSHQQPSPQTEAMSTLESISTPFHTVFVSSRTSEPQKQFRSPTVVRTDTPALSTPTSSPTNTPEISLFQEIQSLPKGIYTLIVGNNDTLSDYAYLLLKDTGEVVKKFQLRERAFAFTNDLRFYAYNNGTLIDNIWMDTADIKEIHHRFASNCDKPSWSKDNSQLAMLCGDGVHFFEFQDGNWREMSRIARPDEINYLPDDFHILNFPLWMNNGFAYFIDDRSAMNANTKRYPSYHPLYILSQECINDPQKCDLSQPYMVITDNSLGVTAVALSEDDQLLAVAFAATSKGEIRIYDLQTFAVINRISLPTNEQDPNWGQVRSMIWGSQPNQIILSMNSTRRIYSIPDYRRNELELLFDCSTTKVYNCSILSKVIIK